MLLVLARVTNHDNNTSNRVHGGDLYRRLMEHGPFSEAGGKKLFQQLLEGVAYLHSQNVTHRDLKV